MGKISDAFVQYTFDILMRFCFSCLFATRLDSRYAGLWAKVGTEFCVRMMISIVVWCTKRRRR